jgi:catechol 2,3-dioxygenase-like lactoylglutathione lyase family enzyme
MTEPEPLVMGFDHVQITIPRGSEERARAFYGTLLGLSETAKPVQLADRGGLWFAGPGLDLHLGVEEPFTPARKAHLAILVRDLAQARSALGDAGVVVMADDADIGVARFYAFDPFGNRLEFISEGDRGFTRSGMVHLCVKDGW